MVSLGTDGEFGRYGARQRGDRAGITSCVEPRSPFAVDTVKDRGDGSVVPATGAHAVVVGTSIGSVGRRDRDGEAPERISVGGRDARRSRLAPGRPADV